MKFIAGIIRKILNTPDAEDIVYKDTCQALHNGIHTRIDDMSKQIDSKLNLIIKLSQNNGRK